LKPALTPNALAVTTSIAASSETSEIVNAARLMDQSEPPAYLEVARILPARLIPFLRESVRNR
jgi:hypothetical protein